MRDENENCTSEAEVDVVHRRASSYCRVEGCSYNARRPKCFAQATQLTGVVILSTQPLPFNMSGDPL